MESNRAYDVTEADKIGRKWLDPYLRSLDPETDYERIISIFAQYSLDMMALHFTVLTGTMHNIQPATGAETLAYTNKIIRRPAKRNEDGLAFFWTWFGKGPSHPDTAASIERLNQIHMNIARKLPGNFSHNDEFIYTLAMIGIFNYRLFRRLGLPEMPDYLKIAMHHELRGIASHFRGEHGPLHSFPETFDGLVEFVKEFDAREYEPSPVAKDVCEAMMADFSTRWFPKGLRWFGRAMMIYGSEEKVLKRYGVKTLNPATKFVTHWMMKTMFFMKMVVAPDRKISFLDTWKPMTNDEVLQYDREATKVADNHGWTRGGAAALRKSRPSEEAKATP